MHLKYQKSFIYSKLHHLSNMANYQGDIPLNADKFLFAQDLIYWFLIDRWPTVCSHVLKRADVDCNDVEKYREFIYIGFDEVIKAAMNFLDDRFESSVWAEFVSMQNAGRINSEAFTEYANNFHGIYFLAGFEARNFLEYCARLVNLTGYFYVRGKKDIIPLAVDHIVKAFPEGDMFSGAWDILKKAGEVYVKLYHGGSRELTPSDSSMDLSDSSSYFPTDSSLDSLDSYSSGTEEDGESD